MSLGVLQAQRRRGHPLDHHHFHAALRCALQHHFVHEAADQEDAAATRSEQVLRSQWIGDQLGVEAGALIAHPNDDARGA